MPHEPKKRHSKARQGKRRSSIKFQAASAVKCQNCASLILPHTVCKVCGYYKGKQIGKDRQKAKITRTTKE